MVSIAEVKKIFAGADIDQYEDLIKEYAADERDGVRKIVASAVKKVQSYQNELKRLLIRWFGRP